jgi:hypothetical protein
LLISAWINKNISHAELRGARAPRSSVFDLSDGGEVARVYLSRLDADEKDVTADKADKRAFLPDFASVKSSPLPRR